MGLYKYRYCRLDELDKLKRFINEHWKKGHILSISDELILFQHAVKGEDYIDFVVAENIETGEFDGIYGYINNWKYAPSHNIPKVLWGAVWKVREDVHNVEIGKVGLGLLRFILKNEQPDYFASLGISGTHKEIATKLNYCIGDINRFYFANNKVSEFRVIKAPMLKQLESSSTKIEEINFPSNVVFENNLNIFKDIEYFKNRYYNHPFYKYRYLGLYNGDSLKGLFVFRRVDVMDTCVLRIMDFIGDLTQCGNVSISLQALLERERAEYIDCLNYGISSDLFNHLGFCQAYKDSDTIIPEYFDPFDQRYVPMEYAYISEEENPLIIFKADADQDRPNSLKHIRNGK